MQLYGASGGDNSYYSGDRGDNLYYQASKILEALQRRNDTFYVVSFHKVGHMYSNSYAFVYSYTLYALSVVDRLEGWYH